MHISHAVCSMADGDWAGVGDAGGAGGGGKHLNPGTGLNDTFWH